MEDVGGIVDYSEEKMRNWFKSLVDSDAQRDCYFLILNGIAKPVGEICFHHFDSENRSAGLNIKVHAKQRGHGYGKDALVTFLAFFFRPVGGRVMTDTAGLDNGLAKRLLLSSGFEIDDSYSDVCMMFMTREMYLARYKDPNKTLETIPDGLSQF